MWSARPAGDLTVQGRLGFRYFLCLLVSHLQLHPVHTQALLNKGKLTVGQQVKSPLLAIFRKFMRMRIMKKEKTKCGCHFSLP